MNSGSESAIKILVVDDHPVVRSGLVGMLGKQNELEIVGEASTGRDALDLVQKKNPDVVLVDLSLPDMDGITLIGKMKSLSLHTQYVVLTTRVASDDINRCLAAGAHAYLFKDVSTHELVSAIRIVAGGGHYVPPAVGRKADAASIKNLHLTNREREVLLCMARGLNNEKIAGSLAISPETVKTHVQRILHKFGLDNRMEAVATCLRMGIIRVEDL
jgi:DNA-binding NarL/FixJ family response regulator